MINRHRCRENIFLLTESSQSIKLFQDRQMAMDRIGSRLELQNELSSKTAASSRPILILLK